ncbi:hypothetical protein FACS18942_04810 [Planctomycetales bacterium]|nr:hypothetical protein FACS18942_04810 [Planctomycetales bacterium]
MARQFSFGTVFRMTEKPFLKSFFETFEADVEQVPWDKLKRNDIDLLLKLFDELPPDKRDEAEVVLRHVHVLSCEHGVQTLGEAADELHADESWGEVYLSEKNLYTKAMSAWLTHCEIFDHAVRFYEMDSLSWWRKRVDLPKITPVFDETVKKNLENELEQFFRTKQGRGFVCTAEMFARSNGTYYFYARSDDYVRDTFVHDKDKHLVRQERIQAAVHKRIGTFFIFGFASAFPLTANGERAVVFIDLNPQSQAGYSIDRMNVQSVNSCVDV